MTVPQGHQTNSQDLEPKGRISQAKGRPIEKGWKLLSWAVAFFTFAVSAATFVQHHPVRELAFCVVVAASVFGLVRLGLKTVKEFYERSARNHS